MRSILKLGSGVPYLNTFFLLHLFLKGTTIRNKSILFFSLVTSTSRKA